MAIRTLGELKKTQGLPALKALLGSTEPFVAEYAANAIAAIEGKPAARLPVTIAARQEDLNLLPRQVDVAGQYAMGTTTATTAEQMVTRLDYPPGDRREAFLGMITSNVIEIAEKAGNFRMQAATVGVFANAPNAPGYGVIIFRGKWDAAALTALLTKTELTGAKPEVIEGLTVVQKQNLALIAVSDERLVLLIGDAAAELPVTAMVKAVKKGSNDFGDNAEMAKLLAGVDTRADLWVASNLNDGLRQIMPAEFRALDTGWATVHRGKDDSLTFKWEGNGKDAAAVKQLNDMLLQQADHGVTTVTAMAQNVPQLKPLVDFLKSIHCATEDGKLIGGASLKDGSLLPALFLGVSAD